MALEHARQPQVITGSPAAKDLAGAMLRRSFSRRPNKSLYWPPMRAVIAAFLTAGLWPCGLLICRLWKYATHQRFRAGELARWLQAPDPPVIQSLNSKYGVHDVHWTGIAPRPAIFLSMTFWIAAATIAALGALNSVFDFGFLHSPTVSARMTLFFFVASGAAAMLQISAVFGLRERIDSCFRRPDMRLPIPSDRNMPLWCLWPAALALLSIPAKLAGFQFAAMWIVTATAAVLASEIQRGYISVADRRLRLSVARAIGAAMYSEARR